MYRCGDGKEERGTKMNIVILTPSPFPDGNAASTYVLNCCRVMTACGHHVTVIGCRRGLQTPYPARGTFEGIDYINFETEKHPKPLVYLFDKVWYGYELYRLSRLKNTDIAFLYGQTKTASDKIHRYCKKRGIKFGAFNCEWYSPESFGSGIAPRRVRDMVDLIPFNAEHADVAIQISTLLTSYFEEHHVKTIMLPNMVDLQDKKWDCRIENAGTSKLKLAYAGVPGVGKDELGVVIEAMCLLPEPCRSRTELHIWGLDTAGVEAYMGEKGGLLRDLAGCVVCHGRANQADVPRLINECHYTVLIRKPSLRTNAGFSTKMVESFAAGVPVMANLTGDIGDYLKDGINGIVVQDDSVQACAVAIERAFTMLDKNPSMRVHARKTAEDVFEYHNFINQTDAFFQRITKGEE